MQGYHPETYGERIAEFYDEMYGGTYPGPAVAFLSAGARGGRVLELAIGTGRNALLLAEVHGLPLAWRG